MFKLKKVGMDVPDFDGYESSWLNWWAIDADKEMEDWEILETLNIHSYYQGPGRVYGHQPIIHRYKDKVVVMQNCGLDI